MRILEIRERRVPISRYADPSIGPASLSTSVVAVLTDHRRSGEAITGYGFGSIGRFAQGGLIRERFAPRLLEVRAQDLLRNDGPGIDPFKAWSVMMSGEKPGGHGERCVAVGALDMAIWDAAAKAAGQPLYRFLAETGGRAPEPANVSVYAGGGYYYPSDDASRLTEEIRRFVELGFECAKIKIGSATQSEDVERIEAAISVLGQGGRLAVDAMNAYASDDAIRMACALEPYGLRWFEDFCDPLDYETHAAVAREYGPPISAGEALFSSSDARNLLRYGGLRAGHDVLTFDPVHCYGLPEYLRIIELFETAGWSRNEFQPHGGHLFALHVAAGLGLGGCECNPHSFQPFGGFSDGQQIANGVTRPPNSPGIGFETRSALIDFLEHTLEA